MAEYAASFVAQYAGLGLFAGLAAAGIGLSLLVTSRLGPKLRLPAKSEPFEYGESALASPRERVHVGFYVLALSFVVFDVALVFLYSWAVVFRELGWFGLLTMLAFLFVLSSGFAYEWMKGALDRS